MMYHSSEEDTSYRTRLSVIYLKYFEECNLASHGIYTVKIDNALSELHNISDHIKVSILTSMPDEFTRYTKGYTKSDDWLLYKRKEKVEEFLHSQFRLTSYTFEYGAF